MPSAFLERLAAACFTPSFEVLVAQKEGLCKFFIEMSWEHQEDVLCQGTLNLPASEAPLKCLAFRPFRPILALSMAFCVSIFHLGLKWTETDGWTVIHRLVSGSSVFFSRRARHLWADWDPFKSLWKEIHQSCQSCRKPKAWLGGLAQGGLSPSSQNLTDRLLKRQSPLPRNACITCFFSEKCLNWLLLTPLADSYEIVSSPDPLKHYFPM